MTWLNHPQSFPIFPRWQRETLGSQARGTGVGCENTPSVRPGVLFKFSREAGSHQENEEVRQFLGFGGASPSVQGVCGAMGQMFTFFAYTLAFVSAGGGR